MKRLMVLTLAVLLAPGLAAQQRDSMQRDTSEAEQLRARIEERFNQRVQEELRLSQDQATKLRASQERFGSRRRQLMQLQMQRRHALDDQMQPGVAANSDSVRKLLDGLQSGRAEMVKIDQDENQEMSGYLTPVQRARYQQMRGRLMQRAQELRSERRDRGFGPRRGIMRGGAGPRRRGI